jgi:signal transduction histidine kinase
MAAGTRAALLAGALPVVALGIVTSRLAAAHADAALGGGAPWESAVQVGAAAAAIAAGTVLVLNRRVKACGVLLALTGPAILLAQAPVPEASSALLFTAALAGGSLAPALAGSAALTCPVARLCRVDWALVTLSLITAGAMRGLLPATMFDPRETGCFECPANLAEVRADPSLYTALVHWGLVLTIAWGTSLAVLTVWRWSRAPRIVRLVNGPLVLGGAAISLLAAVGAVHALRLPTPEIDTTLRTWWLAQCGLVALMAAGVAASGLRARRLAGKVTEVVLTAVPDAGSLTKTLAASIDDPDLALVFPGDDGTVVDAAGRRSAREADSSLAVIRITRADAAVAEVRYRASLTGASHQLAAAVRAAGLGIEQAAARARLLAELTELAASRQRIVKTGDAERRRLERDLHDGAQQRLIALQVLLQMASSAAPHINSADYSAARREVGVALEELRDLAHGIHPVALTDAGLRAGLRTLAETSPVPLIIHGPGSRRQATAAEAAAYRLVADTVSMAGQSSSRASVTATLSEFDDMLRIQLSTDAIDAAAGEYIVARAQDRIVALEGSVTLAMAGAEMAIEAVIPCAS